MSARGLTTHGVAKPQKIDGTNVLRFTRFNHRFTLISVFESEDEAFGVGLLRFKVQGFPAGCSVAD